MIKLTDTNNVILGEALSLAGQDFHEVPAIGDGNCGLNAFGLGLINLIKLDQLNLAANNQACLLQALHKSVKVLLDRLAFYTGHRNNLRGGAYSDLAGELGQFISFIQQKPSYDELVQYIKNNSDSRIQVATLHVGLAPALRAIGAELHIAHMERRLGVSEVEDSALVLDGQDVGFDVLRPLAYDFFGVNLNLYGNDMAPQSTAVIVGAPVLNLHRVGVANDAHWNFLLPATQEGGIKGALTAPVNGDLVSPKLVEIENLGHSDSVLQSMREKLKIVQHPAPLSRDHGLIEMRKALITGNIQPAANDMSDDERLARSLQNAEVLSFLCKHYTTLANAANPSVKIDELVSQPYQSPLTTKK